MLTVDEAISTLQSSLQTFYGLFIGFMAVLSDLKDGKRVITQTSPSPSSSSLTQSAESEEDSFTEEYVNANHEKGRVVSIIRNVLACWHFIVNMLYLIKRAVAVKVHIADPEKITINPMRVKKLTTQFHNKFMK